MIRKIGDDLLLSLTLAACKKEKHYTTWMVNNERFTATDVHVVSDTNRYGMTNTDENNKFHLSFPPGYGLPQDGVFPLQAGNATTLICDLNFYYNGRPYLHTPFKTDNLLASSVEGKACYTLNACWFVYIDDLQIKDSVLISGYFYEP